MNEKTLVSRLKGGDTTALEKIIRLYSGYVRTVARNFSRGALSSEDIDEITADVFYKLYARRGELDESLGLRPYISAAARNAVKNRFRQKGRTFLPEEADELFTRQCFLPEEQAELSEMMRCLAEGLRSLSEEEREIFFRFYFYGERSAAIAKKLGTTENNVNTRLHRARGKLKGFLNERGFYHA